jgi:hypothetical protein
MLNYVYAEIDEPMLGPISSTEISGAANLVMTRFQLDF